MNKLVLFFLIISSVSFSQNKKFTVEDDLIIWKNVYEDSLSTAIIKNNPRLYFETDSTGYIKKTNFNNDRIREMTAEFKIESKIVKYRVSVYNIKMFVDPIGLDMGGITMQSISEYTIEKSILKSDGTIKKSKYAYGLIDTLDYYFTELFTIKNTKRNEW